MQTPWKFLTRLAAMEPVHVMVGMHACTAQTAKLLCRLRLGMPVKHRCLYPPAHLQSRTGRACQPSSCCGATCLPSNAVCADSDAQFACHVHGSSCMLKAAVPTCKAVMEDQLAMAAQLLLPWGVQMQPGGVCVHPLLPGRRSACLQQALLQIQGLQRRVQAGFRAVHLVQRAQQGVSTG